VSVEPLKPARDVAAQMMDVILPDLPFARGDEVCILISGLGATPVMELYILYDHIARIAEDAGLSIYRPYVGNYFTSLEMAGVTLTIMKLDDELKACIDYECDCMGLTQFGR
jgi:dihydroxyacetone kinase-like protein